MNAHHSPLEQLLEHPRWRSPGRSQSRQLIALPASEVPPATLLRYLDPLADHPGAAEAEEEILIACRALRGLDPGTQLGRPGTRQAQAAVETLVARLETIQLDRGSDPAIDALLGAVRRDGVSVQSLATHMCRFAHDLYARDPQGIAAGQAPSFSLVLMRDADHGGAVARSLAEESGAWQRAIKPRRTGQIDRHAAIIPPPLAADGVTAIAHQLGIADTRLPGVAFLGSVQGSLSSAFADRLAPSVWTSWSFCSLDTVRRAGPYPAQLAEIYQQVYAQGVLGGGDPRAAAVDRAIELSRGRLKPFVLVVLALQALLGPAADQLLGLVDLLSGVFL